jgi:hypothetical protein
MNTATKGTGAAAMLATAVVVTIVFGLDLYGVRIPDVVNQAWQGALTILFGWLIHSDTVQEEAK